MVTQKAQQSTADRVTFSVEIGVGDLNSGPLTPVTAVVDDGVFDSALPASLLKGLGLEPVERDIFVLDDGSQVEYDVGMARIALDGREWHCPVIFGPDDQYLLGATTLEIFTMTVDMVEGRLITRELRARPI